MLKLRGQLKRQKDRVSSDYLREIERYYLSGKGLHHSHVTYLASILGPDVPEDPRERIAAARKILERGKSPAKH